MSEIEYVFGTGDGVPHGWSSPPDLALGGALDAVRLDFDGDGLLDDALWDADRDGIAELAALDLTDDGVLDHFYTDPTDLGTWNHEVTGVPEDAAAEPLGWVVRGEGRGGSLWTEPQGRVGPLGIEPEGGAEADGGATSAASAPVAGPDISWPVSPCLLAPQPGTDPPPPPRSPAPAQLPLPEFPRSVPVAS
ncbi:hypothetical protein [Nocardia jiangsuensis]|uniref:VCBS repeat protein n=1 Tax=Nocardia jiangsuensis TaxID=1691563 RepID=A0ABV8DW77_9NOCA